MRWPVGVLFWPPRRRAFLDTVENGWPAEASRVEDTTRALDLHAARMVADATRPAAERA